MRDQTCARVLEHLRSAGRTAGAVVRRQTLLRAALSLVVLLGLGFTGYARLVCQANVTDDEGMAGVLVAGRYIPAFESIKAESVELRRYPVGFVPPGSLRDVDELVAEGRAIYASAVALPEGQPITRSVLHDVRKNHGMASLLPSGKVAVSFAVDRVSGAGGWVQPGDRISIFHASSEKTRLLFQAATVLSVNRSSLHRQEKPQANQDMAALLSEMQEDARTVLTVVLNAFEAQDLIAAQQQGSLVAVLRSIDEH